MKRILFIISITVSILFLAGCSDNSGEIKASLGQEFTLHIGKTAVITGENLELTFDSVAEDSRCPIGAICIWAGRAVCTMTITYNGKTSELSLTEPGLSDGPTGELFDLYKINFRVEPYPEVGKSIDKNDYRMIMTVSK